MLINKQWNMIVAYNQSRCKHIWTDFLSWLVTSSSWKSKSATSFSYGFSIALESFCNGFNRNPRLVHLSELINAYVQKLVMSGMGSVVRYGKVFNSVIQGVFVYVVDNFTRKKRSSNCGLHNDSVNHILFSVDSSVSISGRMF